MAGEQISSVRLLRLLAADLAAAGHQEDAAVANELLQRVSQSDSPAAALEELHGVQGLEEFALRLLWCTRSIEAHDADTLSPLLIPHHIATLRQVFLASRRGGKDASREGFPLPDMLEAATAFARAVETTKDSAMREGVFVEILPADLDSIYVAAADLDEASSRQGRSDVQQFAAGISGLVRYIISQDLMNDARVVNLLDQSASVLLDALHRINDRTAEALRETIKVLEQPAFAMQQTQDQ